MRLYKHGKSALLLNSYWLVSQGEIVELTQINMPRHVSGQQALHKEASAFNKTRYTLELWWLFSGEAPVIMLEVGNFKINGCPEEVVVACVIGV